MHISDKHTSIALAMNVNCAPLTFFLRKIACHCKRIKRVRSRNALLRAKLNVSQANTTPKHNGRCYKIDARIDHMSILIQLCIHGDDQKGRFAMHFTLSDVMQFALDTLKLSSHRRGKIT